MKLINGKILKIPLESLSDSNNSFPPPGNDLNKTLLSTLNNLGLILPIRHLILL